jgi:adenylylsulfate kinase
MLEPRSAYITRHEGRITRAEREKLLRQRGVTVWFTGLSASGKSTVAALVEQMLHRGGRYCCVLDGDNMRFGLNRDLGFSPDDRIENVRRVGEVAKLFTQNGAITLTAFISPYRSDRDHVRAIHEPGDLVEVFVDCPLEECERRDPRGLYAKARAGAIRDFTGISAPYEPPTKAEIVLHTDRESEAESAERVVRYLEERGYLRDRFAGG